ncbi:uncharacterized protein BDR25DRAFT_300433 [Lindgomyces ingoldianus]|uniref:Uncharacterized protein n=1 Tax=Lindgomyces ingoldianus TaxID=673940 RepID=A0ACB6RAW6_9PLEO|nr:uncharacterized protein BDR25DRAFT_300433 [Lindgomyces ingoldianus]KAF2476428.1 hypothetical protein BDR25DRAFT_300433 [Lindgomyces ingoldianus]
MSLRSVFVATTVFLASASAHIIMAQPVPYSVDKIDNSPITASQFPCKSQNGFTVSTMNKMAVGSKQTISFKGTAVHGGGSCQLSVTMDTEPTANSKFKVIKSIEGGCPGVEAQTNTYDFELPDAIPNGKATFAWTWFSKMSGAPELYMNCAPIEVTGGASDTSKFDQLPDMFVANINNGCTSPQNFATKFPNPGSEVQMGNTNDVKDPTGNCGSTGGGNTPASSAAGGSPSSAPISQPASSAPAVSSAAPSNPGGVFAPGASSSAAGVAPAQSTLTTLVTVTGTPSTPVQATSAPAAGTGTGTPASPTAPSTGGGATCSQNGAIVCNGANQFGLCNNGNVVWQNVAAGTTCSNGTIQKRAVYNRQLRGRVAHARVVPGKDFTPSD